MAVGPNFRQVLRRVFDSALNALNVKLGNIEGAPASAAPSKALLIGGTDGTNLRAVKVGTDGAVGQAAYNGSTWDAVRNNAAGTLLASAGRTSTTPSAQQVNYNARGAMIFLNVTGAPGGGETLTPAIRGVDPVSSVQKALTAFGTITTNELRVFIIEPGALETTDAAGVEVQGLGLPRDWDLNVVHSSTGLWTYSAGYSLLQ